MIAPAVLDKINALPETVQEQLFLYVDFLYAVYRSDAEGEDASDFLERHELSDEGKAFLEKRLESALANPDQRRKWQEVRDNMARKYSWPENWR